MFKGNMKLIPFFHLLHFVLSHQVPKERQEKRK